MSQTVHQPLFWLVWASKGACIGALAAQIMEFFHCFVDEVEHIWQGRVSFVTYLYAWSRYFPIVAQIVNLVFMEIAQAPSARDGTCLMGFITKAVTAQIVTTCVELILLVRVHALYNRSRRTGALLGTVFITGFALEVTSDCRVIKSVIDGQNAICTPPPYERVALCLFAAGVGLVQSTLLLLTVTKLILRRKLGWARTPLASLMLRDSIVVFTLLVAVVATVVAFELARNMGVLIWNAVFSWYVSLLSIVGCRVIMNMRRLGPHTTQRQSSAASDLQQFTSVLYPDSEELACLSSLSD